MLFLSRFASAWMIVCGMAILSAAPAISQNLGTLSGSVKDENNEVLPGAHVYIANTTIGDISNPDGSFIIRDVQAGSYQLVVTMIGYKAFQTRVHIQPNETTELEIKLDKDVYEVGEITVTDERPKNWRRDLVRFKRMFLGITDNRRGCDIENPYLMDFSRSNDRFLASAPSPVVVINKALGYKVTYLLEEFSAYGGEFRFAGEPLFEELEPKNDKEAKKWASKRKKAYTGSVQHFLRSLAAGSTEADGFELFLFDRPHWQSPHTRLINFLSKSGTPVDAEALLTDHDLPHERALAFDGYLHVFYDHEMMDRDFYEWVGMPYNASKEPVRAVLFIIDGKATFNEIGFFNNPFGAARLGYWNWESGICNWLPFDYGL